MRRKIVQHGPATLTLSLPSGWAKKWGIKKGVELEVEELGKELRIKVDKTPATNEKKEIALGNLNRAGKSYITSAYRQGFDEISLSYNNPNFYSVIQKLLINELMGFEVTTRNSNTCILKDFTGHNKNEFDNSLSRIWFLVLEQSKDSLYFIKENSSKQLDKIKILDNSINKLSNYCIRILNKNGHPDFKKIHLYFYLCKQLEKIADQYKDMCTMHSFGQIKQSDFLLEKIDTLNHYLSESYKLFYKYSAEKIDALLEENKKTSAEIFSLKIPQTPSLYYISREIQELLLLIIEIKI